MQDLPDDVQAALKAKRFADATVMLQAALAKAPQRFDLQRKLAEVAWLDGNIDLASNAARLCLQAREGGWEEFDILKNALNQAGESEEAANIAIEYLPHMPEHPRRMKEALQSLARDEKYPQLIRLSEILSEDAFDNPFLIYHLALGLQKQGEIGEALTIAEYLVAEHPTRPIFVKLVEDLKVIKRDLTAKSMPAAKPKTSTKAGKTEKPSKAEAGEKKKRGPDRKDVRALLKRADDFIKTGQPEKALEELEAILETGAETEQLFMAMAQAAIDSGQQDRAEHFFKEAIRVAPKASKPQALLANLYRTQNRLAEAQASYEAAIELAPDAKHLIRNRLAILELRANTAKSIPHGSIELRPLPMSRYSRNIKQQLFLQDTRMFFNVIGQLVLRDMKTKYARSPFGVAMALLEPIAHIMLIWLIMSFLFHRGKPPIGEHWIFFYATGVLPYLMMMHLGNRGAQGHRPYGRLLEVPIIKPVSVLLGAAISELMLSATATMLIFSIFYYFGLFSNVNNFYAVGAAFLTVWLLGVGIMFLNAGIASFFPFWSTIWHTLHRVIYFASGIFHLAQLTPPVIRDIIIWNPLLIAIEWYRNGFYTLYNPPWLDIGYLAFTVGMILVVGVALETIGSKVVRD